MAEPSRVSGDRDSSHSSSEPESGEECEGPEGPGSVPSLLAKLRAPKPSELARKRKVATNYRRGGKRRCTTSSSSSEPKSVTPQQRVRQFPNEELVVSNRRLFCRACREEISLKSSSVRNHVKSVKHIDGKKKLAGKEAREQDIADALKIHNSKEHLKGETLPQQQQVFRVKVVTAFLRAAVPLNKLESFRDLLEEGAYRLTDRRNMSDLVPFILKQEQQQLHTEISGKFVSVIFDGTTRLGEALAIVVRFVSDQWTIEQRLVRLQMLAKSLSGEEIARELISVLSVTYSIAPNFVLAAMRDRASTNTVALRTMKVIYPYLIDVGCYSHTIDRVGEHFHLPNLSEFIMAWISLFSHSPKTRLMWKEQTGRAMSSYSATRWWSRWEVMDQLLVQFGDVQQFLQKEDLGSPATRAKLLAFITDPQKRALLEIELAAVVDWGAPFVKATYTLEADGALAMECYEIVDTVRAAIHAAHTPNVQAIARKLAASVPTLQQQLIDYGRACVEPGIQYFQTQLTSSLQHSLSAFKAARLFSPQKLQVMQPNVNAIDSLNIFPFLNSTSILDGLKAELPTYLARSVDIDPNFSCLEWWKQNETTLPCFSAAARKIFLVQPSSAASERVFSLLNVSFNEQQHHSLQDYVETSIMLQYNKH